MRLLSILIVISALLIAACAPQSTATEVPLEPGDAARGEQLFTQVINGAPACSTCHTLDGSTLVGSSLQDYAAHALEHAGDSDVETYTRASIVQPSAYVVETYPNAMYTQYGRNLSAQQIADLVAYLLTL